MSWWGSGEIILMLTWLKKESRRIRIFYAFLALVVVDAFDWILFSGTRQGLGLALFFACSIGLFCLASFGFGYVRNKRALLLLAPIAILLFDIVYFSNEFTEVVGTLLLLVLSLLFVILVTLGIKEKKFYFRAIPWFKNIENIVSTPLEKIGKIFSDIVQSIQGVRSTMTKKIVLGILISLPLVGIFIALFAKADPIFLDIVSKFALPDTNFWFLPHYFRVIVLSTILCSILYIVLDERHALEEKISAVKKFDPVIVNIILLIINSVFLLFVVIQIRYLFGSANYVFSNNLTYAQYARNGFFELVKVMIVSGLLLTAILRPFLSHNYSTVTKFLKLLLVAQVLVVAFSALRRMYLYQEMYGFTALRLHVEWFIYFSIATFLIIAYFVISKKGFREYWYTILIFGTISLVVVCSLNVDLLVAKKNVERAANGATPLDVGYLLTLSPDAWPELLLAEKQNVKLKSDSKEYKDWKAVNTFLDERYREYKNSDWRQYNVGVAKFVASYESK
jgi:hypothetical protein